jgi:hypothetical protein
MIVELRQYTLYPGKRDVLIDLFDRYFIEPQEAAGMEVIGQFRDLDDPDRFVWLRTFPDMPRRKEALGHFYGGPVWKEHREAANATMIDSDDVLLLRLVDPRFGFPAPKSARPPIGSADRPSSRFALTVYSFDDTVPLSRELGMTLLRSENEENSYPALPVRTGANVLVAFSRAESHAPLPLARQQELRLEPTARSLVR